MLTLARFLVWENKLYCHWCRALLVWAGPSGQAGGRAQGQRGLGAASEPQPGGAPHCLPCVLRLCAGWSLLFWEHRESGSSVLGESQDVEADPWKCQPGSLCKEAATMGLILVVWQKWSSALFSTDWISPDEFTIHIVNVSSQQEQRGLGQFSGHSNMTFLWIKFPAKKSWFFYFNIITKALQEV